MEKQVTIILLVWWSLAAGKPVVPSRWQATGNQHNLGWLLQAVVAG
jgi:hypothetical protein